MKIEEIVAISGLPGLYKIQANRSNGMIVEEIDGGKSKFVSMRKHQFTPLATVAIYTEEDATELEEVFKTIMQKETELPLPDLSSPKPVLFEYFSKILPEYDRERVMVSDVKKETYTPSSRPKMEKKNRPLLR